MGEEIENGTIHVGEIIGKTLDGKNIYKFTKLGTAENVEIREPQYKEGDFLYEDKRIMIVKSYPSNYHAIVLPCIGVGTIYDSAYGVNFSVPTFRHATEEEKKILIDAMSKDGKRWNEEKKCIEDIPKRKFKAGDKVRIKDGVSSKTVSGNTPAFNPIMDDFIGTTMTVNRYTDMCGYVVCDESDWRFREDWLEPYVEELKKGDLAIFWDEVPSDNVARFYRENKGEGVRFPHVDSRGDVWRNAVKLESVEQCEKLFKGKL